MAAEHPRSVGNLVDLGRPTPSQMAVLHRIRRTDTGLAFCELGARHVRYARAHWVGVPTLAGGFVLWAIDPIGRMRIARGRGLKRRTLGRPSIITSAAVRDRAPAEQIGRLFDVESASDLIAVVEAGVRAAMAVEGVGIRGATAAGAKCVVAVSHQGTFAGHSTEFAFLFALDVREVVVVRRLNAAGETRAVGMARWWRTLGVPTRIVTLPDEVGPGGDLRTALLGSGDRYSGTDPIWSAADLEAAADAAPLVVPCTARDV